MLRLMPSTLPLIPYPLKLIPYHKTYRMEHERLIGIDLGATNVRAGLVGNGSIQQINARKIRSSGTVQEVLDDIYAVTDPLVNSGVKGIGIGVPGVVDVNEGIVYDVQYIPSWVEVSLKDHLQQRYQLPVFVNNDANCFALGEYYFGKGKGHTSMIGLTVGTGLGAGIIINKHLFSGPNCGAGEFGMVAYLDQVYEYYCSGQFFSNVHQLDGEVVFRQANQGNTQALQLYAEMGMHLGNAIKMIMYTYDPTLIVLGGSVRFAYPYFQEAMWRQIKTFAFTKSVSRLTIEVSGLESSGILGAASLYYDAHGTS